MSNLGTSASRRRVNDVDPCCECALWSARKATGGVLRQMGAVCRGVSVGLEFWLIPTDAQDPAAWTRLLWPHWTRFFMEKKKKKNSGEVSYKLLNLFWSWDTRIANENKVVIVRLIVIIIIIINRFRPSVQFSWPNLLINNKMSVSWKNQLMRGASCNVIKLTQ